ncbi:hypothetical protein GGF43_000422 [Coemansia sp. RSA 2618]|nr:hypothetical protein GGF43_000422 [Coemansia sp. RSA 2618]
MNNGGPLHRPSNDIQDKSVAAETISERLRALGDKLQQAAGGPGDDAMRAVARELEELSGLARADEAEERGRRAALDAEAEVHWQALRLACAAKREPAGAFAGAEEQAKVDVFYGMLANGVSGRGDEKLELGAAEVAQHLRLYTARDAAQIPGLEFSYAEVAGAVDRATGPEAAEAPPAQAVRAPKIAALTVDPGTARAEDSEFRMQVVVPPGGLTFVASAEIANGADEATDAPAASVPTESAPIVLPEQGEDPAAALVPASIPAEQGAGAVTMPSVPTEHAESAAAMAAMPVAPAHTGAGGPIPVGYAGFGAPPGGVNSWVAATTGSMSMSAFGMMPLPYPPHMTMQCGPGYPHMYGVPGTGSNGSPANGSPAAEAGMGAAQAGMGSSDMWAGGKAEKAGADMLMPHADYPPQQPMLAGYSVSAPFMYPHMDASNLSTAATGGSENTGSVNSVESASSRQGPEYPAPGQYMWPQQENKQAYAYTQQQQQQQQQQHQQQQQQNYQGYRRRGSGSNGSGPNQRDRRGHNGYHRQRWNNGQHYNRQQQQQPQPQQPQQQHGGAATTPVPGGGQDAGGYANVPSWQ